jgi:hypothetical protein
MTTHRAKGPEFPVVILSDPTCRATRDVPSRISILARQLWLEPRCVAARLAELIEADEGGVAARQGGSSATGPM